MALLNSVISWFAKKRMHQIGLFLKYPQEVQNEWFKKLVKQAAQTEWGKKYEYASIISPQQYQNRVPISSYEDIKPYIDRLRAGEQNLLWPEEIRWFAKSSGTTSSRSKYIPVSNSSLEDCHFKGGKDLVALYMSNHPNTSLFSGRGLVMGGSHNLTEVSNESYYDGDLSAILIQNLPFWVHLIKTPTLSIALMDKWENKIEKMAEVTSKKNVTSISGVPSWNLVLLQKVLEITGAANLLEVWPNLEVFFHGGVSFKPYRRQFENLIPSSQMHYYETYNASEGFFGIQDSPEADDMLLMLDYGIFYEFIPDKEIGRENPKTLLLDEVKTDTNYAMIISTNGGLWRYMIGDTIVFTSLNPHRIQITGRTKNFINIAGEELIIDNAEKALDIACKKCNALVNEYTAAPLKKADLMTHEWIIEFEKEPADLPYFTEVFDNALKSLNSDYEAKRYHNMVLQEPVVHTAPAKSFYKWMKKKGKLGGQNKVPRLSNHRDHVEELLELIQT